MPCDTIKRHHYCRALDLRCIQIFQLGCLHGPITILPVVMLIYLKGVGCGQQRSLRLDVSTLEDQLGAPPRAPVDNATTHLFLMEHI